MATDGPVSRLNQPFYNASDERLLDSVLMMPSGSSGFSARSGRRPGGGLVVTSSGLDLTVAPGGGVIFDSSFATGGPWKFALPTSKTVTLAARPGTGLTRKDLLVARIYDADSGAGSAKELKIEAVTGTAAASPSKPALPPLSLEIGTVDVPAAGSVSFTPNTARTVASGGILPVATTTERDALPSPHSGLAVWNEAKGEVEVYNGSGWGPAGGPRPLRSLNRISGFTVQSATNRLVGSGWQPISADGGDPSGVTYANGIMTVNVSGIYWNMTRMTVTPITTGRWTIGLYRNNVNPTSPDDPNWYDQEIRGSNLRFDGHLALNAGDTLQVFLRQTSGSDVSVAASDSARWELRRVGSL